MTGQQPEENEIAAVTGPFWSEPKTCEALHLTSDALVSLGEAGKALGLVTSDGVTVYPQWQFQRRDGRVEVRPALRAVFQTLQRFDGSTVAVLLHTPSPELDDMTPLDWAEKRPRSRSDDGPGSCGGTRMGQRSGLRRPVPAGAAGGPDHPR